MPNSKEFKKYATKHVGISGMHLDSYAKMNIQSMSRHNIVSSVTPAIIEERPMNVTQIDVFSRLMMDRIIWLGMPIYDEVANIIQAQLLFLQSTEPSRDIQIYVNSPGGSVYAGLGIYDTMQYISCDVATICTGMAASMGAVLLAAGSAGKRSALEHGRVMIHQPLGGAQGQASDMEITVREIKKVKAELYGILSDHSGQSIEKIEQDSDRDYWMLAEEAKEYGLIDEVLRNKKKSDKKGDKKKDKDA